MATYLEVEVNHHGGFSRTPLKYADGNKHLFTDIDWVGMDVNEFLAFPQDFTRSDLERVYFCVPGRSLADGLRLIRTDLDYIDFIEVAYHCGRRLSMYIDHYGVDVEEWILEDKEEVVSGEETAGGIGGRFDLDAEDSHQNHVSKEGKAGSIEPEITPPILEIEGEKGVAPKANSQFEVPLQKMFNLEPHLVEHEDFEEDVPMPMNHTKGDKFLSKMCSYKEGDDGDRMEGDLDPNEHMQDEQDVDDSQTRRNDEEVEYEEECEELELAEATRFNPDIHWKSQKPILGMRFENPKQLKDKLCNNAVANGFQLCYMKNDNRRFLVQCCDGACSFRLWGSWMSEERSFQIKFLKPKHNCSRNFRLGSIVTYSWIGSHYTKEFLHKQKLSVRVLREEVKKKFGIDVSMSQCRRAKQYAINLIEGTLVEHYAKLWSYAEEIRRSNPGSTVKLDVNILGNGVNYFSKFYVCFNGVKEGWRKGCRKIINLDGCFLKGIVSGELLSVVGRDGNNGLYPIAWAVVCVENKENWKWFLEYLRDDLRMGEGSLITLMSDQHKGLLEAVKEVLPQAEHRQCARYIYANFRKRFSGAHFENLFWEASKATTEAKFKTAMKKIQLLSQQAYQHLMDRDSKTWSRAYFREGTGCDAVENGISESFNNLILDARKKPIITMLEEIRMYMMQRIYRLKEKANKWGDYSICPNIIKKLNELKIQQRYWEVLPSGYQKFETRNMGEAYTVDLKNSTCSCRLWQLNGYGCVHSVATISFLNQHVGAYVSPMYYAIFYKWSYGFPILPMNGSSEWPETNYTPPVPPPKRRMPGRPTIRRKKDASERLGKHRVSKAGKVGKCSLCKQPGHNKTTCKNTHPSGTNVGNGGVGGPTGTNVGNGGGAGPSGTKYSGKKRGRNGNLKKPGKPTNQDGTGGGTAPPPCTSITPYTKSAVPTTTRSSFLDASIIFSRAATSLKFPSPCTG